MLYVGEGPRGSNGTRSTLHRTSIFHSATHNQTGPLWCWFPSGWACAHPRPLWVSPTTPPTRLGVSPAASPTPTGVFNQRFEALFHAPLDGALGYTVCFAPRSLSGLSVRECGAAGCYPPLCLPGGMWGRRVCQWSDFLPRSSHTPPVLVPPQQRESSPPWLPVSAPPTGVDECFLFPWCRTSLLFDFLSVLVVQRGTVCLPTPLSLPEVLILSFSSQTWFSFVV